MKRKNTQPKMEEVSKASVESEPEKTSFYSWFHSKLQENPKLKAWQRDQLKVFMVGQGLTENEEKDKYDKAYERF